MNNSDGVAENGHGSGPSILLETAGYGADWLASHDAETAKLKVERDKRVSPPGALGLDPLLDERRFAWKIPDEAFEDQAAFERVFIWQIAAGEPEDDKAGGGLIVLSDQGKKRATNEAPRGIIISAGLGAMDHLYAHGMALGHIVKFVRLAPFRIPVGAIMGKDVHVLVMDVANLVSSEDLRKRIRSGHVNVQRTANNGSQHQYWISSEGPREPTKPYVPEDYR